MYKFLAALVGLSLLTACSDDASVFHYRVIFKPQVIIPDVDFRGDAAELTQ